MTRGPKKGTKKSSNEGSNDEYPGEKDKGFRSSGIIYEKNIKSRK